MGVRSATVRSYAKLNLDLRVLHKRADGFHELRTVFQTISLADSIGIEWERSKSTHISISGAIDIPDNLIVRAAQAVLDAGRQTARLRFSLKKQIPMGAGMGGGSSNAAAVLLALPAIAGIPLTLCGLTALGAELGSDVPFFLYGGTALGIGRGTELYPLPEIAPLRGLVVAPDVHVSTADAYRDLGRGLQATGRPSHALTTGRAGSDTDSFLSLVWAMAGDCPGGDWKTLCANDFQRAVFRRHPVLSSLVRKLERLGGKPAMMTGSGSAVFGLFDSPEQLERAYESLVRQGEGRWSVSRIGLLSRRRYQSAWRRQLAAHVTTEEIWPLRSRYSKK